ncbi:hypothetical protein [Roseospira goensis]|uniref:Uncharacterized protein n=1 Tax=Roseospira goensis TaxID=391922 RepID=A0A7W6WK96_9PROT|nr:hypothetical protein [Roseospira goensis]MBB4285885.1 hypothetical protein [Roseospira goensis]
MTWGDYRTFVGFAWTYALPAFGFTTLPRDPEAGGKASRTIAYQRARIRAHVAACKGKLLAEAVYLEPGDRPSDAIVPDLVAVLRTAKDNDAQLLYVDFASASGWRQNSHIQQQIAMAPVSSLGLPPDPMPVEGLGLFDPIGHFKAVRTLLTGPEGPGREADRARVLAERVDATLTAAGLDGAAHPTKAAAALNQAGLATVRNRPWNADTLRRFITRHMS